jgi:hypothetical protein
MSPVPQAQPATRNHRFVPRTRKGRVGLVGVALLAIAGTAWAIYYLLLGLGGTFDPQDLTVQWHEGDGSPAVAAGRHCDVGPIPPVGRPLTRSRRLSGVT